MEISGGDKYRIGQITQALEFVNTCARKNELSIYSFLRLQDHFYFLFPGRCSIPLPNSLASQPLINIIDAVNCLQLLLLNLPPSSPAVLESTTTCTISTHHTPNQPISVLIMIMNHLVHNGLPSDSQKCLLQASRDHNIPPSQVHVCKQKKTDLPLCMSVP